MFENHWSRNLFNSRNTWNDVFECLWLDTVAVTMHWWYLYVHEERNTDEDLTVPVWSPHLPSAHHFLSGVHGLSTARTLLRAAELLRKLGRVWVGGGSVSLGSGRTQRGQMLFSGAQPNEEPWMSRFVSGEYEESIQELCLHNRFFHNYNHLTARGRIYDFTESSLTITHYCSK